MDWNQINKFIEESGGRAMIIIEGRPALVVMSYDEYRQADRTDQADQADQADQSEESEPMATISEEEISRPDPVTRELAIDDLPL